MERTAEYFGELYKKKEKQIPDLDPKLSTPKTMGDTGPIVQPIKIKEIREAIKSLKNGKAAGPDKIPNKVIKLGIDHLGPHFCDLFNAVLLQGTTPSSWGDGITHIIYKGKGEVTELSNYRGITITNTIYKTFTSILNKRITTLVEKSGVLGQIQNGGRRNRQIDDSLFVLRTIIDKAMNTNNKELSLLFIDLAKAYDSVPP